VNSPLWGRHPLAMGTYGRYAFEELHGPLRRHLRLGAGHCLELGNGLLHPRHGGRAFPAERPLAETGRLRERSGTGNACAAVGIRLSERISVIDFDSAGRFEMRADFDIG
jgi:hypothetical protein